MKSTVKIDAVVLDRALIFIRSARKAVNPRADANARVITLALDEALTILSTVQPQPEVADDQRKAALEWFNRVLCADEPENCNDVDMLAIKTIRAALLASSTPSSNWRKNGEPDPHGARFDCERAKLMGGDLTDDELANAVFMDPATPNIMAAQERIRWLSRQLESALLAPSVQEVTVDKLVEQIGDFSDNGRRFKKFIESYYLEGLRIVRGEGEK